MALLETVNAENFKVGLTATPWGANDVLRFATVDGGADYSGNGFYMLGISFQIPMSSRLDLETGVEYSKHTILIAPELFPGSMDRTPYKSKLNLMSIPVTLKLNFLKYLFVNGGCLLDLDTSTSSSIDDQTGLGAILGFGIKYDFKFGGTIFVNPYIACHSLVPFSPAHYQQRLSESGIRIGFVYNISI